MKYQIFVLALLMLCGLGVVQAQDGEQEYRLHMPSADDYLSGIQAILSDPAKGPSDNQQVLIETISTEWAVRFSQQKPSLDQLFQVFNTLLKANPYWYGRDIFGKQIVQALIDEKILKLDSQQIRHTYYEHFDIEATPRDFDGDGQPEWTLYAQNPDITQRYVVAYKNGKYELIDVPLPWVASGCCFAYYSDQSGFTEEQYFGDMTGDGLPEWVVAFGGIGANDTNFGELFVLQWQNGKIVDISPARHDDTDLSYLSPAGGGKQLFPYGVSVTYRDMNDDHVPDIVIRHKEEDNWGCSWQEQKTFAWQGKTFGFIDTQRQYDDVQGCEIRKAEEAMWSFDYTTAIQHYERGLKLPITKEYFGGDTQEMTRYATARLAIAYKLVGRDQDAARTINSLTPNEDDSPTLVKLIEAFKENLADPVWLCDAAYQAFNFPCPAETDACLGSPLKIRVGETIENSGESAGSPRHSFPSPEQAGCDIAGPLKIQLTSKLFSTAQSPQTQIEKLGYKVLHTIHFDLNNDGLDEWLIWLDLAVPPLFFSTGKDASSYHFAYTPISFLTNNSDALPINPHLNVYLDTPTPYALKSLPDRAQKTIVTIQSDSAQGKYYLCPPKQRTGGGTEQGKAAVIFALWQIDNDQLQFQQEFPFCDKTKLQDALGNEDLPLEFHGWAYPQGKKDYVVPAVYAWDKKQNRYDVKSAEPIADLSIDYAQDYWKATETADAALRTGDFASALNVIDQGLTNKDIDPSIQPRMLFIRTLALEELKRPDEALTEYVTIYKSVPESAWGKLAALHVECAANCKAP